MATVTFDGRSFMVDGRRLWLVAGTIAPSRVHRHQWADRIHAAKLAGLNTICVPVFWSQHEPRAGQFDFQGQSDLRHFVQLVAKAGLMCILRPGPYVEGDADFGGIPPWVRMLKDVKLRAPGPAFLEVCSRYLSALAEQVRDLQMTAPAGSGSGNALAGSNGPIVLVQNEASWTCGDDKSAEGYLGELHRYLREAGFTVPIVNANNLWQGVEGEIDGWTGSGDLIATLRQLRSVRPDQPRVVTAFETGQNTVWGGPAGNGPTPDELQHQLAQILSAGGQYCLEPFHGGTNFGFFGGRRSDAGDQFVTASYDHGAPLNEAGLPSPSFTAVRLISTFASRFGRLLSHLDPSFQPVISAASSAPASQSNGVKHAEALSVIHTRGQQGGVVFLLADQASDDDRRSHTLLLADGSPLNVPIGKQRVVWCVHEASLGGRTTLDYCNLSVIGSIGKVLVCFGPRGSEAQLSVNGAPVQLKVPTGKTPLQHEHEGLVLVVCNQEQIETTFVTDEAVFVGVSGLTPTGEPIGTAGARTCLRIGGDGVARTVQTHATTRRIAAKVPIADWVGASTEPYVLGESARFASIDGPADLVELGCPYGLGWYRLRLKNAGSHRALLVFPQSADRLHIFADGKRCGVVGVAPGATRSVPVPLARGPQTLVVLAENLGRPDGGTNPSAPKGLYGHVLEAKPIRMAKPFLDNGEPVDAIAFQTPLWNVHPGDTTWAERITWKLAKRRDIVIGFQGLPVRGFLVVGGKPLRFLDRGSFEQVVIEAEQFGRGDPVLQFALLPEAHETRTPQELLAAIDEATEFHDVVQSLSSKAEWAFARWEPPPLMQFEKGAGKGKSGWPMWWQGTFVPSETDAPLFFHAEGLTKGQLYVNDHHVGRYFVSTANGKPVGPQTRHYIPPAWVTRGMPNRVMIFDEHGANPGKTRFAYDADE